MMMFSLLFICVLFALVIYTYLSESDPHTIGLTGIYALIVAVVCISIAFDVTVALRSSIWIFLCGLLILFVLFLLYRRKKPVTLSAIITAIQLDTLSVVMLLTLCAISGHFIAYSGQWGRWDAWAIWNMHAAFLADGAGWQNLYTAQIGWSHPDYPLLLPSIVAMFWKVGGNHNTAVPYTIAYITCILEMLTLYWALKVNKAREWGIIGLLVILINGSYFRLAASQYADLPLSLFMLLSLVLADSYAKSHRAKDVLLMGFMAGTAGWVKNEGLLFFVIFSLVMLITGRSRGGIARYLMGAALPVIATVLLKILYAPTNDIVSGQKGDMLLKLTDINRYFIVARVFWQHCLDIYPALLMLALVALMAGYRSFFHRGLLLLLLVLAGYFMTFIMSPRDIHWHVENASDRLFIQLLPSFVYVLITQIADIPKVKEWSAKAGHL